MILNNIVINETYRSVQELKKLTDDILYEVASKNYPDYQRNNTFGYIYGIHLGDMDATRYREIGDFVENHNVQVYFIPYKKSDVDINTKTKGTYLLPSVTNKKDYKTGFGREINVYYNYNEMKNAVDNMLKEKDAEGKNFNVTDIYSKFSSRLHMTLLHELQHAYDEYRSKGMAFQSKQSLSFEKKYPQKAATDTKMEELAELNKFKSYSNLPHEIWARFTQAVTKVSFFDVDMDISENYFIYKMNPLHSVAKKFTTYFENWRLLPEKMKWTLIKRVSQFWHHEQERMKEKNLKEKADWEIYQKQKTTPQNNLASVPQENPVQAESLLSASQMEEDVKNISDTNIIISTGTELYHGTIEEFDKEKAKVGGYDELFWTTTNPAIAQTYIPQSGYLYTWSQTIAMPNEDPIDVNIQKMFGINYDYSKVKFDHHRASSYMEAPVFKQYGDQYWTLSHNAYQKYKALEDFKKMFNEKEKQNLETDQDLDEFEQLENEYNEAEQKLRGMNVEKFKNEYVNEKLKQMGYEPIKSDDYNKNYGWKLKVHNQQLQPADYKAEGRLFIVKPKRDLKIYDTTEGGSREADLTDLDYHKHTWFQQAKEKGYDGIKITDFAQSADQGNVEHTSIGLFQETLKDVAIDEIPAVHHELGQFYGTDWKTPEYKKYKGITEENITKTANNKTVSINEKLNRLSKQQAVDRGMFGPVYHGTTEENRERIGDEGFKVFVGGSRSGDIRHGYKGDTEYAQGIPAPIHHLGYGIYFTTIKSISKIYNVNNVKGLQEYYLDIPRLATINFASPKKMMEWWILNGYDSKLAKQGEQGRIEATKKMTENLKQNYDAVWFKGKGLHKLLDGDQVVVFDPERIYLADPSLAGEKEIGSKVKRTEDKYDYTFKINTYTGKQERIQNTAPSILKGAIGIILDKKPAEPMRQHWNSIGHTDPHWTEGSDYVYKIKWNKGGTEFNVLDKDIEPYTSMTKKNIKEENSLELRPNVSRKSGLGTALVYLSIDVSYAKAYANGQTSAAHAYRFPVDNGVIYYVCLSEEEEHFGGDVWKSGYKDEIVNDLQNYIQTGEEPGETTRRFFDSAGIDIENMNIKRVIDLLKADNLSIISPTEWSYMQESDMGYSEIGVKNVPYDKIIKAEIYRNGDLVKTVKGGYVGDCETIFYHGSPYYEHLLEMNSSDAIFNTVIENNPPENHLTESIELLSTEFMPLLNNSSYLCNKSLQGTYKRTMNTTPYTVKNIVNEEIVNVLNPLTIEGVADVYAEKTFGIPDTGKDVVTKTTPLQGEVVHRDGDWMLIRNPNSLEGLGKSVRGVILPNGDYYTENYAEKIHYDLLEILALKGVLPYNPKKNWSKKTPQESGFLTVQRYKDTDTIAIGESNRLLYDYEFYKANIGQYQIFLDAAKRKNPLIRFENKLVGTKFFGDENSTKKNLFSVTNESVLMKNNL